jgi:hypothetical protein
MTLSEFEAFMFALSQPDAEMSEIVVALAGQEKYLLGANNNESSELKLLRIERSGLRRYYQGVKRGGEWLLIRSE